MNSPGGLRFNATLLARYPQLVRGPLSFFIGQGATSTRVFVALAGNPYSRQALPVIRHLDQVADRFPAARRDLLKETAGNTVYEIDPTVYEIVPLGWSTGLWGIL